MTPWVLLRGLTRESRHWGEFPACLQAGLPEARVLALDLPGNGRLHRTASPCSVYAMVEHCRGELRREGVAPPYRVLAMSLGAMVAVAWAARHPEELDSCVLINTSLRPFSPFHWRLRAANYTPLLRLMLFGGSAERWEATILRLTSRHAATPAEEIARWSAYRRERPVSRANAMRQLLAAVRFRAPAAKPPVRMLALASTRDALVDVRCSRQLARAWNMPLIEHPSAGHDLPLDDGAWVVRELRRWL